MKIEPTIRLVDLIKERGKPITIDGVTWFVRMDRLACCNAKRESCSGENWIHTEKRDTSVNRFRSRRHVSTQVAEAYGELPVWKLEARRVPKPGRTGDNYREELNHNFYDDQGNVIDFKHLKVGVGTLGMPARTSVSCRGNTITLTWCDPRDIEAARPDDVLHVMYINEGKPDGLHRVKKLKASRAGGTATFTVNVKAGNTVHLYPFFGRPDNTAFAENDYYCVTLADDPLSGDGGHDATTPGETPADGDAPAAAGDGQHDSRVTEAGMYGTAGGVPGGLHPVSSRPFAGAGGGVDT